MIRSILAIMAAVLTLTSAASAQQANPLVGTWKINLAKSKFDPTNAPPQDSLNVFKPFGKGGVSNVRSGSRQAGYALEFDGKDYQYAGVSDRDAVSGRRLSDTLFRLVFKNKEEPIQINFLSLSADGRTLTIYSMITPQSKYVDQPAIVYDKQ